MKKTILFVYEGKICNLPPFMALLDSLSEQGLYNLIVISSDYEPEIDSLYKDTGIRFIHYYNHSKTSDVLSRIYNKIRREIVFRRNVKKDLESIHYDILWVIHELTAIKISSTLNNKKYILSRYELRDSQPKVLEKTRKVTQNAAVNVVCEYNRGQILKTWFNLKKSPVILPNKPYKHPRKKGLDCEELNDCRSEKIILYQGIIAKERNLDAICAAVSKLDGFRLVIMGNKGKYQTELQIRYPKVKFIDFVRPPFHLWVTSNAYIGIVTYKYLSLNTIYCAPNKIWEYSGFGIPMLANEVPGLVSTVGYSGCAKCVDTDNEHSIVQAILDIDKNYANYSEKSLSFYNSCNINSIISQILNNYFEC